MMSGLGTEEKTGAGPGPRVDGIRKENIRIRGPASSMVDVLKLKSERPA